jgi:large repetitive protein
MSLLGWVSNRRGVLAGTAAQVLALSVVAAVVVTANGYPTDKVDLNDSGVWTVDQKVGRVTRVIAAIKDTGTPVDAPITQGQFDVLQDGANVVVVNKQKAAALDPATGLLSPEITLQSQQQVVAGGANTAVLDPGGRAWFGPTRNVLASDFTKPGTAPIETGAGAKAAIGVDGTLAVARPAVSEVTLYRWADGAIVVGPSLPLPSGQVGSVTVVGSGQDFADVKPVVEMADQRVVLPGGQVAPLPSTSGAVLQLPGPSADSVLVATEKELYSVPLDGGSVLQHFADGTGRPARPVVVGQYCIAAWSDSPLVAQGPCGDGDYAGTPAMPGKKPGGALVLRVNHGYVVLNDPSTGDTSLTTDLAHVLQWHDKIKDETATENRQGSEQADLKMDQRASTIKTAPDKFGVRPGATAPLKVLANDQNTNDLVLRVDAAAVSPVSPASVGTVATIDNSKALQISASESASGVARLTYVASDGRAKSAPTPVTVRVVTDGSNTEPQLLQGPPAQVLKVPQRGSASFGVLDDWYDPEGDPMTLECLGAPAGVRCSPDGTITVRGSSELPGAFAIKFLVRDDQKGVGEGTPGSLAVRVVQPDREKPIVRPDYAVAVLGQSITLKPLANDTAFGTGGLTLSLRRPVQGLRDNGDGTLTFTPSQPGDVIVYYRATSASSPSRWAYGVVRISVVKPDGNADPVASPDSAGLRSQGSVIVDVLANDFDPSGHLLMVTSVQQAGAARASQPTVAAQVLDGRLLRVSALPGFLDSAALTYTVSNGTRTASSTVTVRAVSDDVPYAAPLTQDDTATVQAGSAVNLPVLDNDADPEGGALTLQPLPFSAVGFRTPKMRSDDPAQPLTADSGWTAFANGDVISLVAPTTPGVVLMTYSVVNQHGDSASGSVKVVVTDPSSTNTPSQPPALQARLFVGQKVTIPAASDLDHGGFPVQLADPVEQPAPSGAGSVQLSDKGYEFTAGTTPGVATFPYRVRTLSGVESPPSTVTVVIAPAAAPAPPVAVPDVVRARPNRSVDVDVLANDFSPSGQKVTLLPDGLREGFRVVDGRIRVTVGTGTVPLSTTYAIEAQGRQATGTLSVTPDPSAPLLPLVVVPDSADPGVDTTVTIPVLKNDSNPNGKATDLKLVGAYPSTVVVSSSDSAVVVRRAKVDQYAWYTIASTIDAKQPPAQGLIYIPGIAQKPQAILPPPPLTVKEGGPSVTLDITKYVRSVSGQPVRLVNRTQPAATGVVATVVDAQHLSLVAAPSGPGNVPLLVTDLPEGTQVADELVAHITVPVTVDRHPADPIMLPASVTVANDGTPAAPVDLAAYLATPDSTATLAFRDVQAPSGVVANLTGSSLVVSAAVKQAPGTYRVTYSVVRTGAVHPGTGVVNVTVTKLPPPPLQACPAMSFSADQKVTLDLAQCISPAYRDVSKLTFSAKSADGSVSRPSGSVVTFTRNASFDGGATSLDFTVSDTVNVVNGRWSFTVYGPPGPATNVVATEVYETAGAATVTWAEPQNKGGVPTLSYVVEATPVGGGTVVKTANNLPASADVTGLDPATRYTFVVVATSPQSKTSSQSQPGGPFGPFDRTPTVESVTATVSLGGTASVSWKVTALGSTLKSIVITPLPQKPASGAGRPCARNPLTVASPGFTGSATLSLEVGCSYTFQVDVSNQNRQGQGLSQTPVEPFDAVSGVPTPKAQLDSSVLGKTIVVSWDPVAVYSSAHGTMDPTSGLKVVVGGAWSTTVNAAVASGSTTVDVPVYGDYSVALNVTNTGGQSATGGSAAVKAAGTPDKATVTAGSPLDRAARITYQLGASNGLAWQSVVVTASGGATAQGSFPSGGASGTGVATFATGTLTNGTSYTFTVTACNELNCSTSPAWGTVVPYGPPVAPTISVITSQGNPTVTVQLGSGSGNGLPATISLSTSGGGTTCPASWTLPANTTLNQTCQFTGTVGQTYSATVTLVQATTGTTLSASGSGTIQNPPPPRTVTVSWGAKANSAYCGGDTSCTYVTISWSNFSTASHGITPHLDGQNGWCDASCSSTLFRSGSSGTLTGYWSAGWCGTSHIVTADVDGVLSNGIDTRSHGC